MLFLYSIFKLLRGFLYRFFSLLLIARCLVFPFFRKSNANCPRRLAAGGHNPRVTQRFIGLCLRQSFFVSLLSYCTPLVGTSGLEPPTSRLSGVRSNHLSYAPICLVGPFLFYSHPSFQPFPTAGGDEEDRTPDPLRAKQVLSQLSYTPVFQGISSSIPSLLAPSKLNNTLNLSPLADRS